MKRYLKIAIATVVLLATKTAGGQAEIAEWFETLARAEQTETVQIVLASECDTQATVVVKSTPFMDSGGFPLEEPSSTEVVLAPGEGRIIALQSFAFPVIYRLSATVAPSACAAPGIARMEALVAVVNQIGQTMAVLRPDFGSGLGELVSQPNPMATLFHRGLGDRNLLAMHNECAREVHFVLVAEELDDESGNPEKGSIGPEELTVLDITEAIDVDQYGRVKVRFFYTRDSVVSHACLPQDLSVSLITVRNEATQTIRHFNANKGFGFIEREGGTEF